LKILLVSRVNVGVRFEGGSTVGWVVRTGSILSSVWISAFSINSFVGDDVGHGLSHQTTVASLISLRSGAIDEILLREGNEILFGQEVASFSGSSGRKGPARTALLLILNWSNGSFIIPVPVSGEGNVVISRGGEFSIEGVFGSKEDSGKFLSSEISELVHGNIEGFVSLVVVLDEIEVVSEGSVTELKLIVVISSLVDLHP